MVWHVWDLHHGEGLSIEDGLDTRVDILRKTVLFDGRHPASGLNPPIDRWDEVKGELAIRISSVGRDDLTTDMEEECWALLEPLVEPTLPSAPIRIEQLCGRPYSCWTYRIDEAALACDLHFANAYQPQSPFKDRRRDTAKTLHSLLAEVSVSRPDVTTVTCGSWLNSFPPFQALFPRDWVESFEATRSYLASNGWWGQYVTSRGDFHDENGRQFRGRHWHPYEAGFSTCQMDHAIEHLEALLE